MAEFVPCPPPGHGTEYRENFTWDGRKATASSHTKEASGLLTNQTAQGSDQRFPGTSSQQTGYSVAPPQRDPGQFASGFYPSVYRETIVRKDERGHYIDPFKNLASKPYGRRLQYDDTHPDKMYGSQWSSELADGPGPYSFPTTTGLDPEIPWNKDLQWKVEGEVGQWPTNRWKQWTPVGECPPYDGHDDQVEYSKYKVQVP